MDASEPTPQPNMLDRMMNPNRQQKSDYQAKSFDPGGSQFGKSLKTGEYADVKQFNTKPFLARAFEGAQKCWLGKMMFHEKKLPENLQGLDRDALKQFASKDIPLKKYAELDKKSSLSTKDAFSTQEITLKGKTQGALDNDQHLQESVKKGLSIEDVRKLLNKAP